MKIAVGLSGGVDSGTAAKLLIDQGHDVCGVTLRLLNESEADVKALTENMIDHAAQTAQVLGIPHRVYDFRTEFQQYIIDYFVEGYRCGCTPNPCYICNKRIKFGLFLERALQEGFDAIATGHYAKISRTIAGRYILERGIDIQKDQSYFLALLTQKQLSRSIFPLAGLTKTEVRRIAAKAGLMSADRADSQDICFVPDGDYTALIETLAPHAFPAGDFLNTKGEKIGRHRGLHRYTIGQRRGLALPFGYPVYVVEKNAADNTVIIGEKNDLVSRSCTVQEVNWITETPQEPFFAAVKTRYRQQLKRALIEPLTGTLARVVFDEPEPAVARGQAAVFYQDNQVLGGGIIADIESTT